MKEFELSRYAQQAKELLIETNNIFQETGIPTDNLPKSIEPEEGPIKLVFIGQYSAGKSSIIKMLTGIDVGIGASITTQKSGIYEWNDIQIVDTPGIQTGLCPDHDKITYSEISHAALLIFVITNEGFDYHIGEHFRKLAVEQKRGNNMILVVNKMDRTSEGNVPEQQDIIRDDICKVIKPFAPEQLYLSFLSTQQYENFLTEDDDTIKSELLEESGYDAFITNLNAFVEKNQISVRLLRPLYTLSSVLQKAISDDVGDKKAALDGAEELLKRNLRIVIEAKENSNNEMRSIIEEIRQDIMAEGRSAAQCIRIEKDITEDIIREELEESSRKVSVIVQKGEQQISDCFYNMIHTIENNLNRELSSSFAKKVAIQLEQLQLSDITFNENNGVTPKTYEIARYISSAITSRLGNDIVGSGVIGTGMNLATSKLSNLSGTAMHSIVKSIGKFVGVKFVPWQALKLTKAIGAAGVAISIFTTLLSIANQAEAEEKQKEINREIMQARCEVREQFYDWGNQVYEALQEAIKTKMTEDIDSLIAEIKTGLQVFQKNRDIINLRRERLQEILTREQELIDAIGQH